MVPKACKKLRTGISNYQKFDILTCRANFLPDYIGTIRGLWEVAGRDVALF